VGDDRGGGIGGVKLEKGGPLWCESSFAKDGNQNRSLIGKKNERGSEGEAETDRKRDKARKELPRRKSPDRPFESGAKEHIVPSDCVREEILNAKRGGEECKTKTRIVRGSRRGATISLRFPRRSRVKDRSGGRGAATGSSLCSAE